jgi:hypothetical protein
MLSIRKKKEDFYALNEPDINLIINGIQKYEQVHQYNRGEFNYKIRALCQNNFYPVSFISCNKPYVQFYI